MAYFFESKFVCIRLLEIRQHYRQYNRNTLINELQNFFDVEKVEELPAINNSWPFLYAKVKRRDI